MITIDSWRTFRHLTIAWQLPATIRRPRFRHFPLRPTHQVRQRRTLSSGGGWDMHIPAVGNFSPRWPGPDAGFFCVCRSLLRPTRDNIRPVDVLKLLLYSLFWNVAVILNGIHLNVGRFGRERNQFAVDNFKIYTLDFFFIFELLAVHRVAVVCYQKWDKCCARCKSRTQRDWSFER